MCNETYPDTEHAGVGAAPGAGHGVSMTTSLLHIMQQLLATLVQLLVSVVVAWQKLWLLVPLWSWKCRWWSYGSKGSCICWLPLARCHWSLALLSPGHFFMELDLSLWRLFDLYPQLLLRTLNICWCNKCFVAAFLDPQALVEKAFTGSGNFDLPCPAVGPDLTASPFHLFSLPQRRIMSGKKRLWRRG